MASAKIKGGGGREGGDSRTISQVVDCHSRGTLMGSLASLQTGSLCGRWRSFSPWSLSNYRELCGGFCCRAAKAQASLNSGPVQLQEHRPPSPKAFQASWTKEWNLTGESQGDKQDIWPSWPCDSSRKGYDVKNRLSKHSRRDGIWKQHGDGWHPCPENTLPEEASQSRHTGCTQQGRHSMYLYLIYRKRPSFLLVCLPSMPMLIT